MFTLLQIIFYLNTNNEPNITLLNHFDSLKNCETKILETYNRALDSEFLIEKLLDNEKNVYLKIHIPKEKTLTYWYCKKAIFYDAKK